MSTCRSCDMPIKWVETEKGKPMPLDASPVDNGNITIEQSEGSGRGGPIAKVWGMPELIPAGEDRYVSHFVTCVHADEHRKAK